MQLDIPFWYLASVLLIAFAVTFTLRALPFAILAPVLAVPDTATPGLTGVGDAHMSHNL